MHSKRFANVHVHLCLKCANPVVKDATFIPPSPTSTITTHWEKLNPDDPSKTAQLLHSDNSYHCFSERKSVYKKSAKIRRFEFGPSTSWNQPICSNRRPAGMTHLPIQTTRWKTSNDKRSVLAQPKTAGWLTGAVWSADDKKLKTGCQSYEDRPDLSGRILTDLDPAFCGNLSFGVRDQIWSRFWRSALSSCFPR